jgi:DNA ligase-associated metallophosphoesterase
VAEAARQLPERSSTTLIGVQGTVLEALPEGALWWAGERLLAVADLHLEKGSSYARRGQMLPPYDTVETLSRLAILIRRYDPATIVALGDSFHDCDGAGRLSPYNRALLAELQRGRTWIWITGNHDPNAPAGLAGDCLDVLALGAILFRHEPSAAPVEGEIAGHLHPAACVAGRGKWVRRPCFVGDGTRLVLPAFGAYAGGLNVLDRTFAGLFTRPFRAFVVGKSQVYAVARNVLRHG